ncbi:putative Eukaryotic translation initiation factor 3 subunit A [Hibiscus syriacus]|uniref:Eukaryotic translation initiation factor 3 subunit A n=1 Tax=Hibiscus syriacus TaxID=106335 RepID=A0A6A3CDE2_HIBSY|nr:putative Eukaryotic translation initiation factor 3 subunit A [Hibiscus syriacus]
MAASPLNVQPSVHARSNSLPSREHPMASQIDENLNRLRASQSASTSSSVGDKLNCLQDLYDYVDMFLQLPHTQQALAQEQQRKPVDELLDGFLLLLDVCGTAKDALLLTKEGTQELQSILRRRRGLEGLSNEVRKYFTSRKAARKAICKALKNLKHMENKLTTSSFSKDGETGAVIGTLKQVEAVIISVLESILTFISGPEAELKSSRWSLVSKLLHQKRVMCEEAEQNTNEIAYAEAVLRSFIKSGNTKHVENVQNELQNSEMCIRDLEEGLESFFRRLIKARVTVLNFLNC